MILIVDDDQSVRTSLARLFRSAGYEARAFASGEEFLDSVDLAAAADGCVILDLHMPGMSGQAVQETLSRREPPVPVVVLTASEDAELRAKALVAGATRVLRKPCDSMVLLAAVAGAIARSAPPPGAPPPKSTPTYWGEFGSGSANPGTPQDFVLEDGRGVYRPTGSVSFDEAILLVRAAIKAARKSDARDLLVDTTAWTGFPSPDLFERFLAAVEWAEEAESGLRLAMVARADLIHPQKFGVLVAANRGLASNIFTTEAEARAWLAAGDGR